MEVATSAMLQNWCALVPKFVRDTAVSVNELSAEEPKSRTAWQEPFCLSILHHSGRGIFAEFC
jgi:hypothetical protein